jgi:hypothetical protein
MPGKKKSAKKKAVKKSVSKRMGGGMMGPKKKMARGGPVKRMGGGMMGPKKKMAKGGATKKVRGKSAIDYLSKLDGLKPPKKPTGRSAAAKKAAMKGVKAKGSSLISKLRQGKGNPAGKDMSVMGRVRSSGEKMLARLAKRRKALGKNK